VVAIQRPPTYREKSVISGVARPHK